MAVFCSDESVAASKAEVNVSVVSNDSTLSPDRRNRICVNNASTGEIPVARQ